MITEEQKKRIAGWAVVCETYLHQEAADVARGDFHSAAMMADSAEWASLNAFAEASCG